MAGGKRASMREGPLAALFRGTAELEADEKAERDEQERRDESNRETESRATQAWREAREPEPEPEPEPDFFTIAVSIAAIRRRIARAACDAGSVVSERTRQASKIAADSVAERLAIR
jgi:hypothetical protein